MKNRAMYDYQYPSVKSTCKYTCSTAPSTLSSNSPCIIFSSNIIFASLWSNSRGILVRYSREWELGRQWHSKRLYISRGTPFYNNLNSGPVSPYHLSNFYPTTWSLIYLKSEDHWVFSQISLTS